MRSFVWRMCAVLMLLAVTATASSDPLRAQTGGFPRTVPDLTGALVLIPARPARVMAVEANAALAHVVTADDLVTAARSSDPAAADWSGVGLLVIAAGDARAFPGWIAAADAADVPVFRTVPITSLDQWRMALGSFGAATGREARAADSLARLEARLNAIAAHVGMRTPPRVLIVTPEGYTFGHNTMITELLSAANAVNAAADTGYEDFRQIDDSAIRALAPDAILLTPAWGQDGRAAFAASAAYADVPAVRAGRVILLPFSPTTPTDPGAAALLLALMLHGTALLP